MNRDRVIYISVLVLMVAVCFGVYQFYFKAKLAKYAQDKALLESLNSTYSGLNSTFKDEVPDTVIAQHRAVVESWKDAISARLPYFNDSEWREYEKPPEDVFILQFWYGEQTAKMTKELWEKAQKKYGVQVYQRIPMDIQTMLGVAYSEEWQGYDITAKLVTDQLERLKYGMSLFELLMDNNAQFISRVAIYDPKPAGFIGNTVEYSRAGLAFSMEMEDLVKFLEKLRMSDKFYSIEGMKVSHPRILMKYEPMMEVEMFLLRTHPKPDATGVIGGGASVAVVPRLGDPGTPPGAGLLSTRSRREALYDEEDGAGGAAAAEPSGAAKFWKWFKRTVLFTN